MRPNLMMVGDKPQNCPNACIYATNTLPWRLIGWLCCLAQSNPDITNVIQQDYTLEHRSQATSQTTRQRSVSNLNGGDSYWSQSGTPTWRWPCSGGWLFGCQCLSHQEAQSRGMSPGFFVCNCVTLRGLNRYGVNAHGPMTVKRPSGSHQHKNMFLLPGGGVGFGGKSMPCGTVLVSFLF